MREAESTTRWARAQAGRRRARLPGIVPALLLALGLGGCASMYPVETTPEGIRAAIRSGDTVRIRTRQQEELTMLVWTLSNSDIRGRLDGGDSDEVRRVRYDRIETIGVRRLDLKKAMLSTFVPVVVGAIIFCNNEDCETRSVVTADY